MTIPSSLVSPSDFFGGLFVGLTLQSGAGEKIRTGDRFNEAVEVAYHAFRKRCEAAGMKLTFWLMTDPLHGGSNAIEKGIIGAVRRDLISLDNPVFENVQLKLEPEEAEAILPSFAGGAEMYRQLAEDFLNAYRTSAQLSSR